jgi:hypothetical protein
MLRGMVSVRRGCVRSASLESNEFRLGFTPQDSR